MRILLTHAYTARNKGDAGIVSGMIGELKRLDPRARITISMLEDESHNPYEREGAYATTSFFYETIYRHTQPLVRIASLIFILPVTLIWTLAYSHLGLKLDMLVGARVRTLLMTYAKSDLVIAVGGAYLKTDGTVRGDVAYILLLHTLVIAYLLRKPVYLYSQSIGPIRGNVNRILTRYLLNRARRIYVREDISRALLLDLGISPHLIYHGVDAGFLLDSRGATHVTKHVIGITVRQWLPPHAQDLYETAIARFAEYLTAHTYQVLFVPQVTASEYADDDRVVARRIYDRMRDTARVSLLEEEYDHFEIKKRYGSLRALIGTRMHSVIFALTSYVPVIAIGYEHKTEGILRELNLTSWMIPIEKVTSVRLRKLFERLLVEERMYRQQLAAVIPAYRERARAPMREILEDYATIR